MKTINELVKLHAAITVTPISDRDKSDTTSLCSFTDYNRRMDTLASNPKLSMTWDDSTANNTQVGDLFAFCWGHGQNINHDDTGNVHVYQVIAVLDSAHRANDWEQSSDRNVLVLSDKVTTCSLVELREAAGKESIAERGKHIFQSPMQRTMRWVL